MTTELSNIIEIIEKADSSELKSHWMLLFEKAAPKQISAPMMRRIIANEYQCRGEGGLSAREERSLMAALKPGKTKSIQYQPGTRLLREWQGVTHEVMILDKGYEWNGRKWRSLSAIAKAITGAHWSGPRFFNLVA